MNREAFAIGIPGFLTACRTLLDVFGNASLRAFVAGDPGY